MDTTRFIGAAFAALVVSLGSSASADHRKTELIDHEVLPRVCSEALQTQGRSLASTHRYSNRAPGYGHGNYNGHGKYNNHKKYNRYGSYQRHSYQKTLVAHHPNGVRAVRLTRRKGKLTGHMVCKYRNGVTAFRANFRRGRMDGNVTQNYRTGAPMLHAYFRHGRPEGVAKTFFRNGQPSFRACYQDGEYQGRVKRWHPTGQLDRAHLKLSLRDAGFGVGRKAGTRRNSKAISRASNTASGFEDKSQQISLK